MNRNTFRLEDLAAKGRSIISGPFGSSIGSRFFQSDGVPVIRGNNLTTDHKKFVEQGFAFVSHEKAEELNAYALRDDILFTAAGTIGQVGIIPRNSRFEKYVISNKQLRIRIDAEKADPDFVFYWLASPWIFETIQNRNTGSTVPLINLGTIRGLPVVLPGGVEDQKKVSALLGAIDTKIELNNRINSELEGMAKLLYDYWFVQFDFPMTAAQATALGKPKLAGHPYRASGGKMIYNETLKRDIPVGWTDGSLVDVATFTNGIACQKYPADGGDTLRVIKIKEMRTGLTSDSDIVTANVPAKVKIKNGDILFSWSASLEVMIWAGGEGALNQHIFKVTSDTHPRSFCYFVLLDYLRHFRMMADLRKTTMGHITIDHLEQSQIAIPDDSVAEAFEVITKPIIDRMVKAHEENQELTQLRDWLLPMLMNGQVTVG